MECTYDTAAVLYFNYNNPLVKKLAEQENETDLKMLVEILYVQALQIGGFSLHNNELGMLNRNILLLMERGLSAPAATYKPTEYDPCCRCIRC